jgi:secretion/DNA translocation related TadE-like protein
VTSPNRERGAAAIWVLACGAVLMVFALTISARTAAVFARHRVEAAADLAALAAAARFGVGGDPCASAAQVAVRNHATLASCAVAQDPGGRSGTVRIRVVGEVRLPLVGDRNVAATARAGRLPAGPG